MRVSINHAGIMLSYNLLELTYKFSMEQQVFCMQFGFSVCKTGFYVAGSLFTRSKASISAKMVFCVIVPLR